MATALTPAHSMLRHLLPIVSHPISWGLRAPQGIANGLFETSREMRQDVQAMRQNLQSLGGDRLVIANPHAGILGGAEDVSQSAAKGIAKVQDLPFVGGAARALATVIDRGNQGFVQGINYGRYHAFMGSIQAANWMSDHGFGAPLTDQQVNGIADAINHATGIGVDLKGSPEVQAAMKAQRQGKPITDDEMRSIFMLKAKQIIMRALNIPMFSPQLATGRARLIGDAINGTQGLLRDIPSRQFKPQDVERARLGVGYLVGLGTLYAITNGVFGGKTDTNPVSTNAGQVDIGQPGLPEALAAFAGSQLGMGSHAYVNAKTGVPEDVFLDPTASEGHLIRNLARISVALYDALRNEHNLQKFEGGASGPPKSSFDTIISELAGQIFTSPIAYPLVSQLRGYGFNPTDFITPMPVGEGLRAGGIQPPTVGGPTPKPASAPRASIGPLRLGATPRPTAPRPTSSPRPTATR